VEKKDGEMKDWPVETQKLISLIGFVHLFLVRNSSLFC